MDLQCGDHLRPLLPGDHQPIQRREVGEDRAAGYGTDRHLGFGAGCATASSDATDPFVGTYFGSGSGAGLEQVQALAKRFSALHPGVEFKLDDAGSETGIALVSQNQIDSGYMSRDLTVDETGKVALVPLTGAGTALAVNAANPVPGLTTAQVRDIFAGTITHWGLVGGQPGAPDPGDRARTGELNSREPRGVLLRWRETGLSECDLIKSPDGVQILSAF